VTISLVKLNTYCGPRKGVAVVGELVTGAYFLGAVIVFRRALWHTYSSITRRRRERYGYAKTSYDAPALDERLVGARLLDCVPVAAVVASVWPLTCACAIVHWLYEHHPEALARVVMAAPRSERTAIRKARIEHAIAEQERQLSVGRAIDVAQALEDLDDVQSATDDTRRKLGRIRDEWNQSHP
jgi:hypothetical protein